MKFPSTKAEQITARMVKQHRAMKNAAAIARIIASCDHYYGPDGWDALCMICGSIRPKKTKKTKKTN